MINVQNKSQKPTQKPKGEKAKEKKPRKERTKKKKRSAVDNENECDESAEDEPGIAEPLSCRKQNVQRHLTKHSESKFSILDMKTRSKDGNQINQQLAISHCMSCIPIFSLNRQLIQVIWLCCNYALKHGVNPIDANIVNLDPRSIKKQVDDLCQKYCQELINMINDLLDEEDQFVKKIKESKETLAIEDRMPKKMLVIGLQSDHARMQHQNFGAIDLSVRQLDFDTMETTSYSLPFEIFQVADRKGKDSVANISHLRTFLTANFEDHITKIGLCGDGGLVTAKFCQTLQKDKNLGHLAYNSGKCTNHADTLQFKWAIYRILNDLNLGFRNLFPNRTISNGRKVVVDETACRSFRRDFHYLLELIQCQQDYEDDNVNIIKFCDQMKALQLESVKNEFAKLNADEKNEALPQVKNPLAINDFDIFRAEFFNENVKIKQQIFTVKSTCDTKQRRLPEQLMTMAATANYAQAIVNRGKFKKSFTAGSIVDGETVPSRLSVSFLKKVQEFCAAVKYTKSLADSQDSENMPFIRLVFISVKIACRFDTRGQKLPLSNEFLQ